MSELSLDLHGLSVYYFEYRSSDLALTNITRRTRLGQQFFDVSKYTVTVIVIDQILSKERWNWPFVLFSLIVAVIFGVFGYFTIPRDRKD